MVVKEQGGERQTEREREINKERENFVQRVKMKQNKEVSKTLWCCSLDRWYYSSSGP